MMLTTARGTHNKKKWVWVLLIALALSFFVWRINAVREIFQSALLVVATPLWRVEQGVLLGAERYMSLFSSKRALVEERARLEEKNASLATKLATLPALRKENKELKDALGRYTPEVSMRVGRILAYPNRSPYGVLVVDVGAEEGVRQGDIVLAQNEIAIGTVSRVSAHSSVVMPFSSPGQKIPVLLGENRVPVTAEGMGGGDFLIRLPKDIPVAVEDVVLFPDAGMHVGGTVGAVRITPSDPFQYVLFQAPVNVYELFWLQVVSEEVSSQENTQREL